MLRMLHVHVKLSLQIELTQMIKFIAECDIFLHIFLHIKDF